MKTTLYDFTSHINENELNEVAHILSHGGIVGIPTETVYGLAANALDGEAVKKIFTAKGRPQDNPLIVHIASIEEWAPLVQEIPEKAKRLTEKYWPGPLTVILKKSTVIPDEVCAGMDTVAVRMPSSEVAQAIIRAAGVPLAAPSANTSGKPSPTSAAHVMCDLSGKIDAVVDGGDCGVGVESTVISLAGDIPRLLRPGGISASQLIDVLGEVEIDSAVYNKLEENVKAASPGMKYMHYSPDADITLLKGSFESFCRFVNENAEKSPVALCFDGEEEALGIPCVAYGKANDAASQMRRIFAALRQLDEIGAKKVFARCPSCEGESLAVYNRLVRAAGFHIIELE